MRGLLALGAPLVFACGREVDSGPTRDPTVAFPEMLRTCPECGDYFADDAPPFCPADGTPLADAGPRGLDEGARVVAEKTRLARRHARRFKLRRAATTILIVIVTLVLTAVVVFVFVANYVVYLKPDPEPAPTPTSAPTPERER